MQRLRRAAADEHDEPVRDRREERRDGPEHQPDEVGDGEEEAEEDGQPRAAPVVVQLEPHRVRRQLPLRADRLGVGVRIAVGEQQHVGVGLRRVAEPVRGEVAEPERHPADARGSRTSRGTRRRLRRRRRRTRRTTAAFEAASDPALRVAAATAAEARAEHGREHERRERQEEAEPDRPARLRLPLRDRDVDRVAGLAGEPGIGVGGEREIRAEVRRVADVPAEEVVHPLRQEAGEERREPAGDRGEEDGDRPEDDPEDVRDREQEPEEDGQPRTVEVVVERELHGMVGHAPESTMRARWR